MAKKRSHIPQLDKLQLEAALQRLDQTELDKESRELLAQMMKAAANPKGETLDEVLKTLPVDRKLRVGETAKVISKATRATTKQARKALLALSDDEWDALVNKANAADE